MDKIIILSLCTIFALFAGYKKALTKSGSFLAWILSIVISYCGGIPCFLVLLITFVITIIIGKISTQKREKIIKNINQKTGTRDASQVFCNVGVGAISLVIYYFTKNNIYLLSYACVMAASMADSMASELGVLSKEQPIDICTSKKIDKGMSGGITKAGLTVSLLGAFLIGLTYALTTKFNLTHLLLITTLGFLGSIIDSILGSRIQVKYRCRKCKKLTEKTEHCNKQTDYIRGIKKINNDRINFLNNLSIFIISIIVQIYFLS